LPQTDLPGKRLSITGNDDAIEAGKKRFSGGLKL
jgi:hypothetical protein